MSTKGNRSAKALRQEGARGCRPVRLECSRMDRTAGVGKSQVTSGLKGHGKGLDISLSE